MLAATDSSLQDFVAQALAEAEPMSQNTSDGNLGFGWVYYALVRNLRPDFVVAIGSRRGFMPFCAARGARDNGHGQVILSTRSPRPATGWSSRTACRPSWPTATTEPPWRGVGLGPQPSPADAT